MYREVSGFFLWRISNGNYTIRQFYAKRCRILCRAKRALFAFAQRSGAMKAPVGLLSDRTVLRSKMEGLRPDKFAFSVKLERVVDECRPAKSCIKKRIYESANRQPELSAAEQANVKNMEVSALPSQKDNFLSQNHFGKSGCP